MRTAPWSLEYADGSANVYRLTQARPGDEVRFEYVPVTPAQSSTGTYSGGDPKQARLAPDDPRVEALWKRVETLEADPSLRAPARAKRTGQFTVTTPSGAREFIVQPGPTLDEADALFQGLRR